jgi:uncharacterized membrane protein YidH (DUF202 family)
MHNKLTLRQVLFLAGLWSLGLAGWSWLLASIVRRGFSGDGNAWVFLAFSLLVVAASVAQLLLAPARMRLFNEQCDLLRPASASARSRQ